MGLINGTLNDLHDEARTPQPEQAKPDGDRVAKMARAMALHEHDDEIDVFSPDMEDDGAAYEARIYWLDKAKAALAAGWIVEAMKLDSGLSFVSADFKLQIEAKDKQIAELHEAMIDAANELDRPDGWNSLCVRQAYHRLTQALATTGNVTEQAHSHPSKMRLLSKPTEAMCTEARGFILGLDLNIRNWQDMEKHLDRGGSSCIPYIREMAAQGRGGHITKWDVADCIWQLMARAHPIPAPEPVSLAQMAETYRWNNNTIEKGVKAVLDAAEVSYVV